MIGNDGVIAGSSRSEGTRTSDPLAALEELAERWDEIGNRQAGRNDWKAAEIRHWSADDLRATIAKTREALDEVEVREEWGVQKRTYPLGTGYRIYGDDEVGARDATPKVIGSGAYVIHRTVTTAKHVTPWTPVEGA